MRDFFKGLALITAALLLFPAIPYAAGAIFSEKEEAAEAFSQTSPQSPEPAEAITEVYIYDTISERALALDTEDYIAAALFEQLPPNCEKELIKAQAVLMYTYILKRRRDETALPTPELYGCDVSTDSSKYPRLSLGEVSEEELSPFKEAAKEVLGEYCSYGGEPIVAAFCYSAGITTESAKTVLGADIPYLKSVATNEPDAFFTTVAYTEEEVFARLTTAEGGYVLLGDPQGWITPKETAATGYVQSVYLDSRFIVSGSEIARLLNLPSARFTFRYSPASNRFIFTVSGSGSLVGLSIRGGNELAKKGYNYKEILLHFFDGINILEAKSASE